jgi:hypothetical protein
VACSDENGLCEVNVCTDVGRVGLQRDDGINGSHTPQATEILADTKNSQQHTKIKVSNVVPPNFMYGSDYES